LESSSTPNQTIIDIIRTWSPEMRRMFLLEVLELQGRHRRMGAPHGGRPRFYLADARQDPQWWRHTLASAFR
jgi:hypothetical protein